MAKQITVSYETETEILRDSNCERIGRVFRRVPDRATRVALRRIAGVGYHSHPPVVVVPGRSAPKLVGEAGYKTWTPNPNGTRVRCHNPKHRTYYHCSTRRVEVGQRWLDRRHASSDVRPDPWCPHCGRSDGRHDNGYSCS